MLHPTPSAQEVFDTVARHLFTQGTPALDSKGKCTFLDEDTGQMCAVGAMIPPEARSTRWALEGHDVQSLCLRLAEEGVIDLRPHEMLLRDLLLVHDDSKLWQFDGKFAPRELARELANIASFYALSWRVVTDAGITEETG